VNSKHLLAIAAVAAAFSGVARADDADASQYVLQFEGTRSRAEVAAEAATVARTRSTEPAGSRVAQSPASTLDASTVRAQAVQAVRLGQIPAGEI
jgi:hypothetical protein